MRVVLLFIYVLNYLLFEAMFGSTSDYTTDENCLVCFELAWLLNRIAVIVWSFVFFLPAKFILYVWVCGLMRERTISHAWVYLGAEFAVQRTK